jgi:hypothetical protein
LPHGVWSDRLRRSADHETAVNYAAIGMLVSLIAMLSGQRRDVQRREAAE